VREADPVWQSLGEALSLLPAAVRSVVCQKGQPSNLGGQRLTAGRLVSHWSNHLTGRRIRRTSAPPGDVPAPGGHRRCRIRPGCGGWHSVSGSDRGRAAGCRFAVPRF
jgi:hypothetical protein